MSGPENTFIAAVHRHIVPDLYFMKNHNPYNGGIADCWYSGKRDLWVEYKWEELPKRPDTIISIVKSTPKTGPSLSILQQDWLKGRAFEGRNCWVIVGCRLGGVVFKHGGSMGGWASEFTTAAFTASLLSRKEIGAKISAFCQE